MATDADRKFFCLYGILLFCRRLCEGEIVMQTEHEDSSKLFSSLCEEILRSKPQSEVKEKKNGSKVYIHKLSGSTAERAFSLYKIDAENPRVIRPDMIDNNSFHVIMAGAFLSCGSITDPNKQYHLEFCATTPEQAEDLNTLLTTYGIPAKTAVRRSGTIVYIKESENIEDLLTLMGATSASLEIMNVKILKDVRNRANRISNCDAANIDKSIIAAERQAEDIELIMNTKGLEYLSPDLRELALIRLENTDLSLRELGEMLDRPIGRSGVNHRLARIKKIADEIRTGEIK